MHGHHDFAARARRTFVCACGAPPGAPTPCSSERRGPQPRRRPFSGGNVAAMRAVRTVDGAVQVVEVPEPNGDGVVVDVVASGICGSDLHLLTWGVAGTLGHEFAGFADGAPVAVQPSVPCGACDLCQEGRSELCRTLLERMYGISLDGGLADRVIVDPSCVVPLPPGLDPGTGALTEPLAVAVHAAH